MVSSASWSTSRAERAAAAGCPVRFVLGQGERLPFANGQFDAVNFTYLIRYVEDPAATLAELNGKGVETGPISDEGWGVRSTIVLPSGTSIGLYQPRHPTAYQL